LQTVAGPTTWRLSLLRKKCFTFHLFMPPVF
jgi:hypothetical protein